MVIVKSVYYFLYQFLDKVMSTGSGDREQKQEVGAGGGGLRWHFVTTKMILYLDGQSVTQFHVFRFKK